MISVTARWPGEAVPWGRMSVRFDNGARNDLMPVSGNDHGAVAIRSEEPDIPCRVPLEDIRMGYAEGLT